MDNIEDIGYDVEAFTKSYKQKAVGPGKTEVFINFMNSAIPKISKDVLTTEYQKQKINEDRLNQAIGILQEKNKMLEENLEEMEQEHGMKKDEYEDIQIKLRKATKQEEILLKKAEEEADKRKKLIDDLAEEKERNQKLDSKHKKAEKQLKKREDELENEKRDIRQRDALGANISSEEASRIKETARREGRQLMTAPGVDVMDIAIEDRSGYASDGNPATTIGGKGKNKRGKNGKKIGTPKPGQSGCK